MKPAKVRVGMILIGIFMGVSALAMVTVFVYLMVSGIIDCEHYKRVYKEAITVTATVTLHTEYEDSDDGTHYRDHITYTVNGKEYKNIQYNDVSRKAELLSLGHEVQVQVSPEDPGVLLEKLENSSAKLIAVCVILSLLLAGGISALCKRELTKDLYGGVDAETAEKDMKIAVRGRFLRKAWLLLMLSFGALCWHYPMLFATKTMIAAGVFAVFWLLCIINAIRDGRKIREGAYQIQKSRLVQKEVTTDGDDNDVFKLIYRSDRGEWTKTVSRGRYYAETEGNTLFVVYLDGEKKPMLHYESNGRCVLN